MCDVSAQPAFKSSELVSAGHRYTDEALKAETRL